MFGLFDMLRLFQQSSQARQKGIDFLRVENCVVHLEFRRAGWHQSRILFDEGFEVIAAEFASLGSAGFGSLSPFSPFSGILSHIAGSFPPPIPNGFGDCLDRH